MDGVDNTKVDSYRNRPLFLTWAFLEPKNVKNAFWREKLLHDFDKNYLCSRVVLGYLEEFFGGNA